MDFEAERKHLRELVDRQNMLWDQERDALDEAILAAREGRQRTVSGFRQTSPGIAGIPPRTPTAGIGT